MEHGPKVEHNYVTDAVHAISLGTLMAAFTGFLPPLASVVAIVWYALLIWESETCRKMRQRHHSSVLEKLKAKQSRLSGRIERIAKTYEIKEFADDPAEGPRN